MNTMRMRKVLLSVSGILMLLAALLLAVPTINAQLAVTEVVYSWDYAASKYQNSNVVIYADGGWSPFLHQFIGRGTSGNEFNATVLVTSVLAYDPPNYTTQSTYSINTRWGGLMDYQVGITDTDGMGKGFQTTRLWSLVFCDRIKEQKNDPDPPGGDLGGNDLAKIPPNEYLSSPYFIEYLPAVFIDQVENCTTGNCSKWLNTRLVVNLDKDGNGKIDPQYLVNGQQAALCFYAEAKRPTVANWGGNLQARIAAGGGDKTVNFSIKPAPTAVSLSSFTAQPKGNDLWVYWLGIAGLVMGGLGALVFARR